MVVDEFFRQNPARGSPCGERLTGKKIYSGCRYRVKHMIMEGQFTRKKGDSLRLPSANGYVGNADNLFSVAQNHKFPSNTHTFD